MKKINEKLRIIENRDHEKFLKCEAKFYWNNQFNESLENDDSKKAMS